MYNHHRSQDVEQFLKTLSCPSATNPSLGMHLLSKGSNLIIKMIYHGKIYKHIKPSF